MAKSRNSMDRQNAVISQFSRDAKSNNNTSAVAQAIKAGKKAAAYKKAQEKKAAEKPMFIPSVKEFYQ